MEEGVGGSALSSLTTWTRTVYKFRQLPYPKCLHKQNVMTTSNSRPVPATRRVSLSPSSVGQTAAPCSGPPETPPSFSAWPVPPSTSPLSPSSLPPAAGPAHVQ